jgi:hypothetical protein
MYDGNALGKMPGFYEGNQLCINCRHARESCECKHKAFQKCVCGHQWYDGWNESTTPEAKEDVHENERIAAAETNPVESEDEALVQREEDADASLESERSDIEKKRGVGEEAEAVEISENQETDPLGWRDSELEVFFTILCLGSHGKARFFTESRKEELWALLRQWILDDNEQMTKRIQEMR